MDVTNIALSGLNAAQKRLANSANNIVNARTPNFQPQEAVQTALPTGGVRVDIVARDVSLTNVQPARQADDIQENDDDLPEVSIERELVDSIVAGYDFRANLKVLKTQDDLQKSLLDIQA